MKDTVPSGLLDDAVREIALLRQAAAYESAVCGAHGDYTTFPKSRRAALAAQSERLVWCATGRAVEVNRRVPSRELDQALRDAGASTTLTLPSWKAQQPALRSDGHPVPFAYASAAMDEIWWLRSALAYEATVAAGHGALKSFPKSRRRQLGQQVERLRAAARGHVERAYADRNATALRLSLHEVGAPRDLSTATWLAATGLEPTSSRS